MTIIFIFTSSLYFQYIYFKMCKYEYLIIFQKFIDRDHLYKTSRNFMKLLSKKEKDSQKNIHREVVNVQLL